MIYMKKFLLALLAAGSLATADAQKGSWLHYGNVGISTSKTDKGSAAGTDKTISWNINPGIGYQFSNHLTAGVQGGYMKMKSESEIPWTTTNVTVLNSKTSEWQVGAFLRHTHYFDKIFSVYHQLDVSVIGGKTTHGDTLTFLTSTGRPIYNSAEDTYTGFAVRLTPAVSINVHDGFCLNFSVGGIGFTTKTWDIAGSKQDVKENSFDFTWGKQFNIGISKNMCPRKHGHHHMEPGMEHRRHKKHAEEDDDE